MWLLVCSYVSLLDFLAGVCVCALTCQPTNWPVASEGLAVSARLELARALAQRLGRHVRSHAEDFLARGKTLHVRFASVSAAVSI